MMAHETSPSRSAEHDEGPSDVRSYYGRPVIKEPEWTWEVPWYLFTGGLAGASSVLATTAALSGQYRLAHRCRLVAAGAAGVSPPLLIADLGRPARFLNMLRVFKPTSVMSVGSWTLAAYSGAAVGSGALVLVGRQPARRRLLDLVAATLGPVMATYTGALVADSSIPVWHEARRHLPLIFAASALASAGAAGSLATPGAAGRPARRLAAIGALAELVASRLQRRHLGTLGEVYEQGRASRFHRVATAATSTGAALLGPGGGSKVAQRLGAGALLLGGICLRWSVYHAGFQSARDPRAVIAPQRERLERRQHTGDA